MHGVLCQILHSGRVSHGPRPVCLIFVCATRVKFFSLRVTNQQVLVVFVCWCISTSSLNILQCVQVWPINRSEEHTSELQSRFDLVCRLLLEKKKILA